MNAMTNPIPHFEIAEQTLLRPHGLAPHQLERVFGQLLEVVERDERGAEARQGAAGLGDGVAVRAGVQGADLEGALDGLADGGEGCLAHHLFVMKEPEHLVQFAGIDRF